LRAGHLPRQSRRGLIEAAHERGLAVRAAAVIFRGKAAAASLKPAVLLLVALVVIFIFRGKAAAASLKPRPKHLNRTTIGAIFRGKAAAASLKLG